MDNEYELEEYKQLRSELSDREAAIRRYFLFCIVSTGSIMASAATLFFSKNPSSTLSSNISSWFPYVFISPIVIILPLSFLMVANRKDIFFIGTYLKVFYDQRNLGTKWETSIEKFYANEERKHSLDGIPRTIFMLVSLSYIAFVMAERGLKGHFEISAWHIIIVLIPYLLIVVFWLKFNEIPNRLRTKYLNRWNQIINEDS